MSNSQVRSNGKTQAAFSLIYSSTIDTGIHNDRIRSHHIESSRIHTGDGDDLIEGIGISNTAIDTGNGNDNIVGTDYTSSTIVTGDGYDNLFFWNMVNINHDLNLGTDKAYKINYQYLDAVEHQFVDPVDLLQNAHAQDVTGKLTPQTEHVSLFV